MDVSGIKSNKSWFAKGLIRKVMIVGGDGGDYWWGLLVEMVGGDGWWREANEEFSTALV